MAHKEIKFGEEARQALQRGVDVLANTVKTTLAAYPALAEHIRANHSYDVPEVLCTAVLLIEVMTSPGVRPAVAAGPPGTTLTIPAPAG